MKVTSGSLPGTTVPSVRVGTERYVVRNLVWNFYLVRYVVRVIGQDVCDTDFGTGLNLVR